ncbi:MAG: tRNA (N6-isopentenyl adenosine(37)-C2)-methylthiotransferase MiaB [Ardenticatenaceae bacterium]|nr:tRNA (N6-isopentenyl adenosine(37)-C2)-methylthiotransferase MiaB [Ardenticatenaceae bacterium]HBY99639.1 tRNA (N6-isopentenyl adenosine(37)-C2)-methylthiotransferase MiaB [Chloroflexota bacterium]
MATKKTYYTWYIGCQMNAADTQRVASALEKRGYRATPDPREADVIVLNTCVVRQGAEDKVYGRLGSLKPLKERPNPPIIGLMGCLVGVKNPAPLREKFPFVDVFLPPSEAGPLLAYLDGRDWDADAYYEEVRRRERRDTIQDQTTSLVLPAHERGELISAHVPIIYGCNHMCSFCIIPYRRGIERTRIVGEIISEVRSLAEQGVKEVTLLGQIVDRYGYDIPDGPRLPQLLRQVHEVEGIERIRFLTSHPNYMSGELLDTVAELPKVMEVIEVPVQAGDDDVLRRMRRGYTVDDYRRLVEKIRARVPGVAIHTDIIVGFPGESEEQFMGTYRLLEELKLDKAHLACFSPRPNTAAARWEDDVPQAEKERRRALLDDLQERVCTEINARCLDQTVEVLVEDFHKGKWRGRTRTNKLVFFEDERNRKGELVDVTITWTGPWSMQGVPADRAPVGLPSEPEGAWISLVA